MRCRTELPGDIPAIWIMIARIMRPQTGKLVDRIRGSDCYVPELSRVAVGDDGEITGFVMLSRLEGSRREALERPSLAPQAVENPTKGPESVRTSRKMRCDMPTTWVNWSASSSGIPATTRASALCQRPPWGSTLPKGPTFQVKLGWPSR